MKVTWHTAKYGDPYSEFVLCIYHPKCTHTHREHTVGSHFMLRRPGSSWGFGALLKDTSVVVLMVKRALYIHSSHLQFLPARDSNPQPLDYGSVSLTIRPRLPRESIEIYIFPVFPSCELKWAALWNSQSEQSSTLSRTVKQPIRAELNIEPHCETANQSRAQHWAALWNSQSEQSSTLSRAMWNGQSEQSSTLSHTVK